MLKKRNSFTHIIILIVLFIFLVIIAPMAYSRYEIEGNNKIKTAVAYYVVNPSYQYIDVKIPNMVPRVKPYVYNFSIKNNKDGARSEVSLEYELLIKTTTNLDLKYELYMNEDYNNLNASNIIYNDLVKADEDGTFFREMKAPKQFFNYRYNEENNYTLLIYFDEKYKNYAYQDIIESIFIIIDSKQVVK